MVKRPFRSRAGSGLLPPHPRPEPGASLAYFCVIVGSALLDGTCDALAQRGAARRRSAAPGRARDRAAAARNGARRGRVYRAAATALDLTQPQANYPPPAKWCAPGVPQMQTGSLFRMVRTLDRRNSVYRRGRNGVLGSGCAGGSHPAMLRGCHFAPLSAIERGRRRAVKRLIDEDRYPLSSAGADAHGDSRAPAAAGAGAGAVAAAEALRAAEPG